MSILTKTFLRRIEVRVSEKNSFLYICQNLLANSMYSLLPCSLSPSLAYPLFLMLIMKSLNPSSKSCSISIQVIYYVIYLHLLLFFSSSVFFSGSGAPKAQKSSKMDEAVSTFFLAPPGFWFIMIYSLISQTIQPRSMSRNSDT